MAFQFIFRLKAVKLDLADTYFSSMCAGKHRFYFDPSRHPIISILHREPTASLSFLLPIVFGERHTGLRTKAMPQVLKTKPVLHRSHRTKVIHGSRKSGQKRTKTFSTDLTHSLGASRVHSRHQETPGASMWMNSYIMKFLTNQSSCCPSLDIATLVL